MFSRKERRWIKKVIKIACALSIVNLVQHHPAKRPNTCVLCLSTWCFIIKHRTCRLYCQIPQAVTQHEQLQPCKLATLFCCRPFFFSNIFQSAPAVASYVASALEADQAWARIERFFVSSIDGNSMVKV